METQEEEPIVGDITGDMTRKDMPCSLSALSLPPVSLPPVHHNANHCARPHDVPSMMFMGPEAMVPLRL